MPQWMVRLHSSSDHCSTRTSGANAGVSASVPECERDVHAAHDGVDRGCGPRRGGELDLGGGRAVERGGPGRGLPGPGGGVERGGVELEPARDGARAGEEARLHPQLRGVRRQPRPQRGQQPRAQGLCENHRDEGHAPLGLHWGRGFASGELRERAGVRIAAVAVEGASGGGMLACARVE